MRSSGVPRCAHRGKSFPSLTALICVTIAGTGGAQDFSLLRIPPPTAARPVFSLYSAEDLLDTREKMNKVYALYSNVTTIFPLLGMLGTVWALIPMVNTIGTADTSNFFSALTSTFWGIVAAILFKALDSTVSYKIEDNEKHTEHLIFKE